MARPSNVAASLMNAQEFAAWVARPENADRHFELERGEVIEMPPPKRKHGFVCNNVAWRLTNYAEVRGVGIVCTNDAGVIVERDPDTVRGPDVAYFDDVTNADDVLAEYAAIPPVVAVEVLSPEDRVNKVANKVDEYLAFGVRQVWVVDPETKDVAVHRPGQMMRLLEGDDELAGGDELPGFSCRVSDFFRLPGQKAT
ncbi:MAG: Uma2 family endonuclease [Candidatus Saccharimonas sp.]|nr:Uma2 family endonuclease [Planctomycetaceae bacterium]